ncbi:DUF6221 family protein [Streptomyces globisporus]|uniref:DUF6221 family protein n=1 Tax=Streptomyces globisporus TaxID=1908 RepID=UPI0036FF82DB
MDLHTWITQQVESIRLLALNATPHQWQDETSPEHGFRVGTKDGSDWVAFTGAIDDEPTQSAADAKHIAAHDPDAVLRRCNADLRILARHRLDPNFPYETACYGCGTYGDLDLPNTDNLNDCPELLDLAHAHGITDEILASLDRPQPPEPKPSERPRLWGVPTSPITTSDVPAALRGPRWKP